MRNKAESPQQGGLPDDPHGLPTGQLLRGHGGRVASLRPVPRLHRLEGFGRVRYVIVIGLEGHVSTNIKTRLSNRIAGWDGLVQENVAGAILAATFAHRSFDPSSLRMMTTVAVIVVMANMATMIEMIRDIAETPRVRLRS